MDVSIPVLYHAMDVTIPYNSMAMMLIYPYKTMPLIRKNAYNKNEKLNLILTVIVFAQNRAS